MPPWRNKAILGAGLAALALSIPALGQEAPKSLLPEGFGDSPAPAPTPTPAPAPAAPSAQPAAPGPGPAAPTNILPPPPPAGDPGVEGFGLESLSEEELAELEAMIPPPIEIPDFARRPTDMVGPFVERWSLGYNAWGRTNGQFLATLMRRLDAPLPSRWLSIQLKRALLTRAPAPAAAQPVNWVAERAWLLLRMGEADGARMLVDAIDVDQFTPRMFQVGVQSALATADPAGLCPLAGPGGETSDEPVWGLAEAICAGLRGDAAQASSLIDRGRNRGRVSPIDIQLAEKIVGAGPNARRSVTIDWEGVDRINSWRFGLASAAGLEIPAPLMNQAQSRVWAWQARAPMVPLDARRAAADRAAAMGVFSNRSLVEMYSLIGDRTDPADYPGSVAQRLRESYVAPTFARRMEAMRGLWNEDGSAQQKYARSILTAVAASRLSPDLSVGDDVDALIASMLSAGLDRQAARWAAVVDSLTGQSAERAWALLAVGSPRVSGDVSASRVRGYGDAVSSEDGHAAKLLVAALAGLGRISESNADGIAGDLGIDLRAQNLWTRALDRAANQGERGTVVLLAAVGMQTGGWMGVPASHLFHIVSAMRRVGMDYEARMIAAEAIARS